MLHNSYLPRLVTAIIGSLVFFSLTFVSPNIYFVPYLVFAEDTDVSSVSIVSLTKLRLSDPVQTDSPFLIHVIVTNNQEIVRPYLLLVEARDSNGVTITLEAVTGSLGESESRNVTAPWMPESPGRDNLRLFAISDFENPEILSPVASKSITTIGQNHCDDSLWNHVYYPPRLAIVEQCISVTGTVTYTYVSKDGDQHVGIRLDHEFAHLINQGNIEYHNGALVTESICQHPTSDASAARACKNFEHHVDVPSRGTHVRVTGTYVLDTQHHSWAEIHPVTSIIPLKS